MGTSIFDILKLVSQLQTAGPFEKMFDNQVAQDFGINLPPGPSVDISMEKQVRQPVMPTNVTPEPPGLANIAASILQRQPQNFPAQSAPQAAPQQSQDPGIASLLPLIAGAGELFNPFSARGGPVSVGSKINDAIRSMVGTQQGLSQIDLMNARARSGGVGGTKLRKRKFLQDGVPGELQETIGPGGRVIDSIFVPERVQTKLVTDTREDGSTVSRVVRIGHDGKAMGEGEIVGVKPVKGLSPKDQLEFENLQKENQSLQNNLSTLLSKIEADPNVAGGFGQLRGVWETGKEIFMSAMTGRLGKTGPANQFANLQRSVSVLATPGILNEVRNISDTERETVMRLFGGGNPFVSPAEVHDGLRIVQRISEERGIASKVLPPLHPTKKIPVFHDMRNAEDAVASGLLKPGMTFIDAQTGNTLKVPNK
jgi:hypothetical protein